MGMTGKELLENYKKKRQGNNVSSEETTETTGTQLTGSQLLDNYNRKKQGLPEQTLESTTESAWDKYKEFANSKEAASGWQKYLADTEASKQAEKKVLKYDLNEDGEEAWWEKALGRLGEGGNAADATLPMHMTTQAINDLRTTGLPDYTTPEDDWNDEQRNIFGYLYSTNPSEASKYAEYLNTEAKEKEAIQKVQDSATDNFWAGAAHTAGAIATAPLGLADFLNDLVMANAGVSNTQYDGIVSPFEYSQAVTGGISEHLNENYGTIDESVPIIGGKGWGDVYGLGTSIAQSAVSGYTMGGLGTLVSYFGQGAASGVDDALSRGASEEQAVLYGTVLGVAEGLAEQIGIDNLFKLGASPTLKVAIKNILKQAGAEGMEEGLTSIISNIADNAIMQDQSNFNAMVKAYMEQGMTEAKAKQKAWLDSIEGIAFDTLGGAISGGVHAGVHTGIKSGVANYNASKIYGDSVQDLLAEAADIGGEAATVADKYRAKYENKGKLSGAALNEIVYANEQEMRTQDKSKIKSAVEAKLTEYGETGDVSAIADILVKQASGEQLTSKETNILNSSKAGHIVSGELNRQNLKSGLLANDWARDIETDKINSDVYTRDLYNLAEQKVTNKEDASAEAERVIEPKFKVSESGKTTVEGNEVSIKEVASIKDGDITLRLENGETVNANDVEFSSSDEMLYATVVDMNLNAETANAFIRGFNAADGLSVDQYALGFREAYKYGSYGFPVQEMSRDGFSSALSESQKSLAYGLGKVDAKYAVEAKQNAVKNTKVTKEFHEDSMSIEEAETVEGLTDRQKTSIKAMRSLSNALGLNVRFFESKVNDKGKRVGENGRYDPSTGILYIDLYAGLKGEGTILFTAGHELTHFIRQWSPAKFKVFADVLLEKYGKKGVSVDALVREQIEKAKRKGRDISYDTAYEEVIADSCEAMLADGDAFATVSAKIKAKDKSLWKKIKEFFTDLVAKIKAAYTGLKPDSPEGQFVSDMLDTAEQLKALWTEALVEASENYAEAESIVSVDTTTESVSPMFSERTWTESDYVVHRDQMAKKIANALGITEQKAKSYIDDINSIARMIANDRVRLDYEASSFGSAFVSNVEYGGSFDYTTLCKKRRIYTGTFTEIQKRLKDTALSPDDILTIRNMLIEEGIEATCGLCYVEGSRANMGKFAKEFIRLYKRDNPLAWIPNMADVNTPDGVEQMRISHPEAYDQYVYFWNHYGKLKDSDPALFASQQKPKLYESRKEYKGEILEHFKGDTAVEKKNLFGGIRMQSFSDFEIVHLIDTMQVIMDMSTVGLAGQAYTKVPEFAKAFGNTGLKINLSLIAKGVDADGNLIFDDREGMPHETAFDLRNKYSENVGTIIVTFTDAQLLAAMADPRIDYIIPFHRSQWKKGQYGAMGLPKGTKDYTYMQNEKLIKPTYHEYRGRLVKDKATNYMPNEYWDFSKSGKENAEAYLKMCAENNKRPKFYKFLDYDGKGTYSLKADGSTDGYWKLLIDFKMYDNDGVGSPQRAVTPTFNMDEAKTMLDEYKGGHASYPVAHAVVDRFVEQYENKGEVKYSDRDTIDSLMEERLTIQSKLNELRKTRKELEASEEYNALIDKVISSTGSDQDSAIEEYNAWMRRSKYDELVDEIKALEKTYTDLNAQHKEMSERKAVEDERKKIEESGLSEANYFRKQAIQTFGYTPFFYDAGYLLPNGKLLNFSGEKGNHFGSRGQDHRAIETIYATVSRSKAMLKFMSEGNIRVMAETPGLDISSVAEPTSEQYSIIKKFVREYAKEKYLAVDITDENGSVVGTYSYENNINADRVVNDIKYYFQNGTLRPQSSISAFRYSDRDTDSVSNRSLLANALESVAQNDIEKTKLAQYKEKIALIESEQKKLEETRAKIRELSFAKGARDTEAIKKLQFDANQMANRINTYDKQLLSLESTKALKGVLEREKATLRKKMEQKNRESLANYREKAAKTQRELLTRYQESRKAAVEGRHKTEMRHKIKKVVSDLNKLLLNPTKEQHVPIGLQGVVADALDAINMDTMNAEERVKYYNDLIAQATTPEEKKRLTEKRDFFAYRDMNFKERITALKNAYAEFKESDDPLIRNAHNDAIAELIKNVADSVGNISLKDMSFGQLEAVYDMYKAVLATVRNANKMFKEGRQETVTENSEAVKVEVKEVGGHQDRVLKSTKFLKKFGWDMLKPVTAMKVIGSKTLAKLFDNVRAAEDTWAVDVNEAKEFYKAISDKYGYDKWDFKAQHSFKDGSGEEFSISLEQMLSLYAYSKREQADEHLEFGGFIFDDAIEVTEKNKLGIPVKYEVNDANPHRLGQIQIMEIIGKLTQEQRAFVDEMQTYLSEVMGAKGNEVSLALYDIKLYKEKNYFPLKTARYFREFDPEKSGTPKIKNSGFSKKTVPQAGNPIVLSNFMDVWASHVNDMSMYHAFVLPLEDFMRVYNYSSTAGGYDSVQQYIKNAYGSQANQYIERLMDDLNGGARVDSSADPINKGISLFKKASVFASASVVVQQPSAIARAFAYINPKYFATSTGSALNLKKHKEVWAEVKKYAPVAVIKEMGYFDTGMGRSTVEWIKGNKTIKDKMDDALSKAPAKADELSWSYIWLAVKNEIKDTTDLTPGSEEFMKKVGERFTEIITNTQVYDSVLSRSGMMRSKDTGMKMATAFMAEPTTTVNMMVDGILQGKRGNKKFLASTVGAVSASVILNSILVALVYAARDDDEDETYTEKYVGSLTTELVDGFNPLTYIPFVKDIWSIAQGYDVERSDMSVVSNLWESIEGLFNENKSGWEKVTDATGAVSSLFGIPLKNIIRDAKGMYNLTETLLSGTPTTGAGISESIGDAFTSSIPLWDRLHDSDSNADRLYKAMVRGDQTQINRIKNGYANEQAFESAQRQALRDNDSRIKEAAQARFEGDIAEYTRIAKEIIREGNFSQDIVVGAINAEINAIKRDETTVEEPTEDKDEVTSIYSGSDVNSAFDNGDYTLGKQIISELIETKVANGMIENNAKSSIRSSMTSYWKPLYKEAYRSGDTNEMARIRQILYSSGLYGTANEVVKTTQSWLKD